MHTKLQLCKILQVEIMIQSRIDEESLMLTRHVSLSFISMEAVGSVQEIGNRRASERCKRQVDALFS